MGLWDSRDCQVLQVLPETKALKEMKDFQEILVPEDSEVPLGLQVWRGSKACLVVMGKEATLDPVVQRASLDYKDSQDFMETRGNADSKDPKDLRVAEDQMD